MFQIIRDKATNLVLNGIKEKFVNPKLDGIGVVEEIRYADKELFLRVRLEGLEDHPLEIKCSDIKIAPDGSTVAVGKFDANKKFAQTALDNFAANQEFNIPEGAARMAVTTAKKVLGL